jgi:hypothetical protein
LKISIFFEFAATASGASVLFDFVIHPTNTEHREWMERLRDELRRSTYWTHPTTQSNSPPLLQKSVVLAITGKEGPSPLRRLQRVSVGVTKGGTAQTLLQGNHCGL